MSKTDAEGRCEHGYFLTGGTGTCPLPADEHEDIEWITVTLEIDNIYEDGERTQTVVEATIPPPPGPGDEYDDWEQNWIFEQTGTGKEEGDAGYFVEVVKSSHPHLLDTGTEYEFC